MEEIKISTPGNLKPLPYEISEEVKSIAEKILNGLTTHAKIAYVASYKQSKWIGKCQLVPAVFKLLTGYDYIIYVNMEYYEGLSYKQKEALLFHELEHIGWKQNIKDPEIGKWTTRRHDIEEFNSVVQKYGRWLGDVEEFSTTLKEFDDQFDENGDTLVDKETGEILFEEETKQPLNIEEAIERDSENELNSILNNFILKIPK
jgi:predicted metallopeptidase